MSFEKEELIDRFMSLAFNRIIEQHRTSFDLNVDMSRKDHSARAERPPRWSASAPAARCSSTWAAPMDSTRARCSATSAASAV
jgi:hypothetical protein